MSNRTLVEFNHDLWGSVADDPDGFAAAILEMLRGGGTPDIVRRLEHYGITYVGQRHHSERVTIAYSHHKVEL